MSEAICPTIRATVGFCRDDEILCLQKPTMSNHLTREQEEAYDRRQVRMQGKNAKRRSEAPDANILDPSSFVFRARWHNVNA